MKKKVKEFNRIVAGYELQAKKDLLEEMIKENGTNLIMEQDDYMNKMLFRKEIREYLQKKLKQINLTKQNI